MTAAELALQPGDRIRLVDDGRVYTVLRVMLDPTDEDCCYVLTDEGEAPLWICADDVAEILI